MRIAFMGSSGTGKTALANFISAKYGWPLNPVGARSVAEKMGFSSPYDVNAADKRGEFQRQVLADKREWEAQHEDFVTDRTPLDNLVYCSMHGAAATVDFDAHIAALKRYDLVFHCPMRSFFNVGTDPVRVSETTYHRIFEIFLYGIADHWGLAHYVVEKTGLENRKTYVAGVIDQLARR